MAALLLIATAVNNSVQSICHHEIKFSAISVGIDHVITCTNFIQQIANG